MMTSSPPRLRAARASDAEAIADLLRPYAERHIVLPRTAADIRAHVANFMVAAVGERIVGAVALRDFGDGLQEIRSLVVHVDLAGGGLGSRLIAGALDLARSRQARRVFALTLRPNLFERSGFVRVEKELFPQKVWSDCARCVKRDCCDESALVLDLTAQEKSS